MAEDAALASQVENLKVSDEVKPPRKNNRGARSNEPKEKSEASNDSGVLQEPRIRSEHDNRFNYPNRSYGRDGGRDTGRGRSYFDDRRDNIVVGRRRGGYDNNRDNRGGFDRDNSRDGERSSRDDRGGRDNREVRDNRSRENFVRGGGSGDNRSRPQQQDANYAEQQRARAEQRRIKMQVMLERQKDYVAKQKSGDSEEPEKPENNEEFEDEEGKDEGDVWGHDGWDKIVHDQNPKRRNRQDKPDEPRKEEAGRYINPHLRSQPKQEEWIREQDAKKQQRAQENEQKRLEDETKAKERSQRKQFVRALYVPPQRKAAQQAKEPEAPQTSEPAKTSEPSETPEPPQMKDSKPQNTAPVERKAPTEEKNKGEKKEEKRAVEDEEGEEDYEKGEEEDEEGEEEDEEEEYEDEDEEDDDDEYEDVEDGEGGVVLIMQVEISPGLSKALQVRQGDNPAEVAERFCVEHGMAAKFIPTLTKNIQHHIAQQENT